MRIASILVVLLAGLTAFAPAQDDKSKLPTVVLLGDSIRLSYTSAVTKRLEGRAVVISPKPNGGDSDRLVQNLEEWAIRPQPAVVHFNCGIHDIKKSKKTGQLQVPPERYEANLRKIVERLRKATKATVLFATTTPILDDRAAAGRAKADYELLDANAEKYNEIARRVMQELKVPVNDLRADLGPDVRGKLMSGDGVHFTGEGAAKLGSRVADFITSHLPTRK